MKEPIWEVDYSLFTKDSLDKADIDEERLNESGYKPFTPTYLDELIKEFDTASRKFLKK